MGLQLRNQARLSSCIDLRRAPRTRFGGEVTSLSPLFERAFDGGQQDAKDPYDFGSRVTLIHRSQDMLPQILRRGFHLSRLSMAQKFWHTAVGVHHARPGFVPEARYRRLIQ